MPNERQIEVLRRALLDAYGLGVGRAIFQFGQAPVDLAAAYDEAGWSDDMEAAPHWVEVDGYREDAGDFIMKFGAPAEFLTERECVEIGESAEDADWFAYNQDGMERLEGDEKPTHWRPRPTPPKETP